MKRRDGFVYALVNLREGAVKIGSGRDLLMRYTQASNWNATELFVHSEVWHEDALAAEFELHRQLNHARWNGLRSEWFDFRDAQVALTLGHRGGYVGKWLEVRRAELRDAARQVAA